MSDKDHGFEILYQVQYQQKGGKPDDWFIMTGRTYNEKYHSEAEHGMHEITSMDEAVEIAEALVRGYSHPHKRDAYYWKKIVASRVMTRVYAGTVSATYGTPNVDVPRETSGDDGLLTVTNPEFRRHHKADDVPRETSKESGDA